jgi:chromosome segregation ATPase
MDPSVRRTLTADVADELHDCREQWEHLEAELETAKERLHESEAREQFLGMRLFKYKSKLAAQARYLEQEERIIFHQCDQRAGQQNDPENQAEDEVLRSNWERRKLKLRQASDLVPDIQGTYRQILVQCEALRRTIQSLEIRCRHFQRMQRECFAFVAKAHELEDKPLTIEEHSTGEEGASSPEVEMEMSRFIRSSQPSQHYLPRADDIRSLGSHDSKPLSPPV